MPKMTEWQDIAHYPLTGLLDVRSRPADLPLGAFRWKLNAQVTPEGKLRRRAGFNRAFYSGVLTNHDLHHQGNTREIPNFLFESTDNDGNRRLFAGTTSKLFVLDETTGEWTTIVSGLGAYGHRWKCAQLQDTILFTNGVNDIQAYNIGAGTISTVTELILSGANGVNVRTAEVIVEFNGFLILMNLTKDGSRQPTCIAWCDLNAPMSWKPPTNPDAPDTLAGYQSLAYEDEILAAAPLLGAMYIYTRRAIWKMTLNVDVAQVFSFARIYYEPKNQKGCLLYPHSLVSTGEAHYFMSRDGIYKFSPYSPIPEREDWLHRASGAIYLPAVSTAMNGTVCHGPVAEFVPEAGEVWFSWPSAGAEENDYSLVAQLDQKTADIVDHGFSTFVNYRRTPTELLCNEAQLFLGVSTTDWCLKEIGGVFYRLLAATGDDLTVDIPQTANYYTAGYNTVLRGMIATGLPTDEKLINNVRVEDDTVSEASPPVLSIRIGNSEYLADPNNTGDSCPVQWKDIGSQALVCSETKTPAQLLAANLRPALGKDYPCFWRGKYLYYEISVVNADGSEAIGGDACFYQVLFRVRVD